MKSLGFCVVSHMRNPVTAPDDHCKVILLLHNYLAFCLLIFRLEIVRGRGESHSKFYTEGRTLIPKVCSSCHCCLLVTRASLLRGCPAQRSQAPYHGDESADKAEVGEVVRVDGRGWVDLQAVIVLPSVFK